MPIKLSSAFLIRVQLSFSAKKNYSLIDFLAKAMFRQMVPRIIWLLVFELPCLSDRDDWETWGGKSGRCLHWMQRAGVGIASCWPWQNLLKAACLQVTVFVRDSCELHRGFVPCSEACSWQKAGTAGRWMQPGLCLKNISEFFQKKKEKSW